MGFYNFAISGTETITEDFEKIKSKLNVDINDSLNRMSIYLITQLQNHINTDVYKKYYPHEYKRRSENSLLGRSLLSEEYMDLQVNGTRLSFTYLPSGEHQNSKWNLKDGNDLINVLQTAIGYRWESEYDKIPPRPFWNLFIEDVERNFESRFIFELQSKGYDVKQKGKGFILDGTEKL